MSESGRALPEVVVPPLKDLGPAMRALTPLQRRFVISWMGLGMRRGDGIEAAIQAGVQGKNQRVRASQLLAHKKIKAAIAEEAVHFKGAMGWRALARASSLIDSPNENTALAASKLALEMEGHMVTRSEITHKHEIELMPTPDLNDRIAQLEEQVREEFRAKLALAAPIEGDFVVVDGGTSPFDAETESPDDVVVDFCGAGQ